MASCYASMVFVLVLASMNYSLSMRADKCIMMMVRDIEREIKEENDDG